MPSHAAPTVSSRMDTQWKPGSRTDTDASAGQKNTGTWAPTGYRFAMA